MLRRLALLLCLALAAVGMVMVSPAAKAAGGGGCQLLGSANFSPNGPGATPTFSYSVTAALSDCQSSVAGAPTSGTLEVGQQVVKTVTIQTPTGPQDVQATYAQPLATGTGAVPVNSCPGGATSGTGIVTWPDGTTTVVTYATNSVGPAVQLEGDVVPSVDLTLVSGPAGSPATYTVSTTNPTFPVGDGAAGALAFTTDDPTPCTTAQGLSNVALEGIVGIGNTN